MGHKATDCKARRERQQRVEAQAICNYCHKSGHYKLGCFKLLRMNQILGNIIQRYGAENATTDSVLIIYTHMSSLKTSGLVMVEHLVTTAIVMKVCLIKEQFSK
jgi:hypothetical protein